MAKKFVYNFSEGNDKMRNLLGGKGANLALMKSLKMPVPDGFIVSTDACNEFYENEKVISSEIQQQILKAVQKVEKSTGKIFGSKQNPLLFAVRSGARVSMPGMMDSLFNIGLNDEIVPEFIKLTNNAKFVYDSYRRLIMMFGEVVKGIDRLKFENVIAERKLEKGVALDADLLEEDFKYFVTKFKQIYKKEIGVEFPQDPSEQLVESVKGVFLSWNTPRAQVYRRMHDIPNNWGTAVNVQTMVFGNMGQTSGSGVAFTRNPSTGEHELYGEYLMNAQGEDVVAGIRTPNPIAKLKQQNESAYNEFVKYSTELEKYFNDVQELEFTIENGKLYMLQTRNAKRTTAASIKFAIDFVNEKKWTKEEALLKIDPKSLDTLLHPVFDVNKLKNAKPIASGLPASPGAATGKIALDTEMAKKYIAEGYKVVLLREETSPEDIEGMSLSQGVLTATGGMTSHAAVVARALGTACVAGCSALSIREKTNEIILNGKPLKQGDYISIDGTTGNIYLGAIETQEAQITDDFATVMSWAKANLSVDVRANADNKTDAKRAIELGANGIGLCRTEHMFFEKGRIKNVREMILATTEKDRRKALDKLLKVQQKDFVEILEVTQNFPITIRLLDMPLHEFLPKHKSEIEEIAASFKKSYDELNDIVESLVESNPMLGFRGCRLSVVYPEITEMQVKAMLQAGVFVKQKYGYNPTIEIMVPLVSDLNELIYLKRVINNIATTIFEELGDKVEYKVGSMIEVPRAAYISDSLAKHSDFMSYGTNDLTQLTYGFSRDDIGKFLPHYFYKNIIDNDPFVRVDEFGVGALVNKSISLAKGVNKNIKTGICGEHAGDPASIAFFASVGADYVSCSPYRVPIAKLASAQAKLGK